MKKLVSIIIPCYNAEKWLREAIDNCLNQTYSPIEIIVIDDGSTDNSLEIIKSYGEKLIWETGQNRGGNYARNRGFALSQGNYIQYLDADDYLLPEKIEKQVRCLKETGSDVIYGDWRYQKHLPDGTFFLDEIQVCGPKEDFLEALLSDRGWIAPMALLFTRDIVESSGGWDEELKAGQDRDFFISVALTGAKFVYQPGCNSIYRRYGNVTVSTSNKANWLENHLHLMAKIERKLNQSKLFSEKYQKALAHDYFFKATAWCHYLDYSLYHQFLKKVTMLDPNFKVERPALYKKLKKFLGFWLTGYIYKACKTIVYRGKRDVIKKVT